MLPDRVSNPGPLTYESGALPIALRGPADYSGNSNYRVLPLHFISTDWACYQLVVDWFSFKRFILLRKRCYLFFLLAY